MSILGISSNKLFHFLSFGIISSFNQDELSDIVLHESCNFFILSITDLQYPKFIL